MSDALPRFLRAIAEHVPAGDIEEVHLFAPMRQAGRETGVAVIAARAGAPGPGADPAAQPEPPDDSWLDTDAPLDPDTQHAMPEGEPDDASSEPGADPDHDAPDHAPDRADARLTIYRASYSWTIKGIERGKWQVDVSAEADAPLAAVDQVVRGVQRRSGEVGDAERLSGDAFRAALTDAPWSSRRAN